MSLETYLPQQSRLKTDTKASEQQLSRAVKAHSPLAKQLAFCSGPTKDIPHKARQSVQARSQVAQDPPSTRPCSQQKETAEQTSIKPV